MKTVIVAIARDNIIGRGGQLVFHLREDLRRFKRLTTGHTVVMGRKTFESLPKGALPDRRNIVITRNAAFTAPAVETAGSLAQAYAMTAGHDIYIIGGGEIYRQALDDADILEVTRIDAEAPRGGSPAVTFPDIDPTVWTLNGASGWLEQDGIPFRFETYRRVVNKL